MPETVADPVLEEAQAAVDAAEAARVAAEATPVDPPAADPAAVDPTAAPVADSAVAEPAKPVVPDTYDLKLPADSTLDAAIVDRTAAIARELGLTNDAAQKLLEATVAEIGTTVSSQVAKGVESAVTARLDALKPGGAEWVKTNDAHKAQALTELAGGDAAKLETIRTKAQQALTKFFPDVTQEQLEASLLASNPVFLKGLAAIGDAMSEGTIVHGVPVVSTGPKLAYGLYQNDGKGPVTEPATK